MFIAKKYYENILFITYEKKFKKKRSPEKHAF